MNALGIAEELLDAASRRLKELPPAPDALVNELAQSVDEAIGVLRADDELSPNQLKTYNSRFKEQLKTRLLQVTQSGPVRETLFWCAFYLYAAVIERSLAKDTFAAADALLFDVFDRRWSELAPDERQRIQYLKSKLPRDLLIKETSQIVEEVKALGLSQLTDLQTKVAAVQGWEERLTYWDKRVSEIQASIKQQAEQLNFVGLSQAFSRLTNKVQIDKRNQASWLKALGVVLLVVPFIPALTIKFGGFSISTFVDWLPFTLPFAVIELVLLYYFRILLRNFYSLDAQELQLELRNGLCAFIESYSDFAARQRKDSNDPRMLDRFESVVFSGITSDPSSIPSQFDGVEQIAKLVKEIRGQRP